MITTLDPRAQALATGAVGLTSTRGRRRPKVGLADGQLWLVPTPAPRWCSPRGPAPSSPWWVRGTTTTSQSTGRSTTPSAPSTAVTCTRLGRPSSSTRTQPRSPAGTRPAPAWSMPARPPAAPATTSPPTSTDASGARSASPTRSSSPHISLDPTLPGAWRRRVFAAAEALGIKPQYLTDRGCTATLGTNYMPMLDHVAAFRGDRQRWTSPPPLGDRQGDRQQRARARGQPHTPRWSRPSPPRSLWSDPHPEGCGARGLPHGHPDGGQVGYHGFWHDSWYIGYTTDIVVGPGWDAGPHSEELHMNQVYGPDGAGTIMRDFSSGRAAPSVPAGFWSLQQWHQGLHRQRLALTLPGGLAATSGTPAKTAPSPSPVCPRAPSSTPADASGRGQRQRPSPVCPSAPPAQSPARAAPALALDRAAPSRLRRRRQPRSWSALTLSPAAEAAWAGARAAQSPSVDRGGRARPPNRRAGDGAGPILRRRAGALRGGGVTVPAPGAELGASLASRAAETRAARQTCSVSSAASRWQGSSWPLSWVRSCGASTRYRVVGPAGTGRHVDPALRVGRGGAGPGPPPADRCGVGAIGLAQLDDALPGLGRPCLRPAGRVRHAAHRQLGLPVPGGRLHRPLRRPGCPPLGRSQAGPAARPPVLDAFFFSTAATGLARWGLVPWWVAVLVTARYSCRWWAGWG